jgi:ubiquinol-cytochrome c reductase cytochrome c subunit
MPIDPVIGPDQKPRRRKPRYPAAARTQLVDYVAGLTGIEPDIPDVSVSNADVATGGELFRLNCAACHAWAGNGGALLHREAPALYAATPTQIAEAVRVGPGVMPAFGTAAIDDRELSDVVAYVRELDHTKDRGGNPLWHLGPVAEGFVAWGAGLSLLILATLWIGERARG